MFRVAVSRRREQEVSFFTVIVWRDQAEHAAERCPNAAGSWSWAGSSSWAARNLAAIAEEPPRGSARLRLNDP
jgi:hypothetical protein